MPFLMMITAFLALIFISIFFHLIFQINISEGLVLSASYVVAILYFTGLFARFDIGMIIIFITGGIGLISTGHCLIRRNTNLGEILTPAIIAIGLIFLINYIMYRHDYIQNIDELHQWASAVKYMLEHGRLPIYGDYTGDLSQKYGTSLFNLFFQKATGYNESVMYVSASLLYWIGFLLPFGKIKISNWKKIALYVLVVMLSFFPMYLYGAKNLYVDLPTVGWAVGAFSAWFIKDTKAKRNDYIILADMLVMIFFFKTHVGLLLDLLIVLGIISKELVAYINTKKVVISKKKICAFLVSVSVCAIFFVCGIAYVAKKVLGTVYISKVAKVYSKAILVKPFSSASAIRITIIMATLLSLAILYVCYSFAVDSYYKKKVQFLAGYLLLTEISYLVVLFGAYLFIFSPEESTIAAGSSRYFSIIGLYLFANSLVQLFYLPDDENTACRNNVLQVIVSIGLLLFFCSTITNLFAPNMTSLGKSSLKNYSDISATRKQLKKVQGIISESDRVYFINQSDNSEFPTNIALYYLDTQVSNYLVEPWQFAETGSTIRLAQYEDITFEDLPDLLKNGGYTYVWLYETDDYIEKSVKEMYPTSSDLDEAGMYKVLYSSDGSVEGFLQVMSF
ncbi:MAG: hypothetical protein E7301_07360 [Butyrivibrio sp.]|nr:hypothetical protein [Butyrivibrio sp.]